MPNELPDRRYPLMMRDPLVQNYDKKFKLQLKNRDDKALTAEVKDLENQIRDKWGIGIHIPETTKMGVSDFWLPTSPVYLAVKDAREVARRKGQVFLDENLEITSLNISGLVFCNPHEIPIIIDPTILTLNDAKMVKDAVWDIVTSEIGKHKKTIKGRDFAVPAKEPEALAAVFRCKSENFEKYLRWYDLKIDEELTFRLIALIEFHSKPEDRERKFEEHISRKKKARNIGPVEEEDAVRKGVRLIYSVIHRKPMATREHHTPTLKKYDCPYHSWNPKKNDWDCDMDCEYLKSYIARLSRSQ